jgi:hypothetical protein
MLNSPLAISCQWLYPSQNLQLLQWASPEMFLKTINGMYYFDASVITMYLLCNSLHERQIIFVVT